MCVGTEEAGAVARFVANACMVYSLSFCPRCAIDYPCCRTFSAQIRQQFSCQNHILSVYLPIPTMMPGENTTSRVILPNIETSERQRWMQRCTFGDTPCQGRDRICTLHTRSKYTAKR